MTCVIFCGGEITDYDSILKLPGSGIAPGRLAQEADFIISADSGARHCRALRIVPDIMVGDFDSASREDLEALSAAGSEVIRYPEEKDMTDSELAVEIAISKGFERVIILGATGTRLDHSMSNIFLLKKLTDAGIEGIIANEGNWVRLINDGLTLERADNVYITLLPFAGDACGVTTQGLYYPLDDATLKVGTSWGVSNRFAADTASISIKKGYLLVIMSMEDQTGS